MDAEEYSPGGDVELYISASLAFLLGLIFTALALANLFGQMLGPKGKLFIFEMDEVDSSESRFKVIQVFGKYLSLALKSHFLQVMGGLLGIPNYSKLEAVLLFLGAVGAFLCWSSEVRSISYHNLLLINLPLSLSSLPSVLLPFSG